MVTMSRKSWISVLGSAALVAALSGSAWAQDMPSHASSARMHSMGAMHSNMKSMQKNMMGMHMMPATVTAADTKTGVVDVMAEGMALKVHFPPKAIANLKVGEKITLHMGFSKP